MKTKLHFLPTTAMGLMAAVLFGVSAAEMRAESSAKRKNPTSKLYVAEVEGVASINTGDRIDDLVQKSVYSAEGTIIESRPDATTAIVLSNGTGMCFDPNTELDIRRFQQEPFSPNRNDPEVEPSISQTNGWLPHGVIGLCNSKMVAGSTMNFSTPQAVMAVHARKVVIETTDTETRISVIDGEVTVQGGLSGGGETVNTGQQAVITRSSPTAPSVVKIQPIPPEQSKPLSDRVAIACMARKTVYFDVDKTDPNEIIPKPVVPPGPYIPPVSPYIISH